MVRIISQISRRPFVFKPPLILSSNLLLGVKCDQLHSDTPTKICINLLFLPWVWWPQPCKGSGG